LAFPIKKEEEGYLVSLNFFAEPKILGALEKKLSSEDKILRYLILNKKVTHEEEISKKMPAVKVKKLEKPKEEKVKLEEIEKRLEEILGES